MKVLITGATGLVGKALTTQLLERGDEVNYLTTRESKVENKDNLKGFQWNPHKQKIDKACFEDVDCIVNLAGASVAKRWTKEHKKAILDSRIDTLNLLHKSLSEIKHNIKHLVSASAVGVYPSSLTKLYDETETELSDDFLGQVVQEWEKASNQFEDLNINVAQLRIGVVLSGDGGTLEQMVKPIKNYVGAVLGSGKQWQSWIHIKDLASMFCYVMDEELTGVYNAVAPNPVNNKKLTQAIAKVLDQPILLPPVPKFALKLLLGEMAQIVLGSQLVSAQKIQDHGFVFEFVHVEQALGDILRE
ncbi:TIGR01777 family oxidoreductase [Psychroflexus sp. MBR-150]|jgi:uncharacterized protein (TIGR01777 family)